jgi:hypothetical protein
LKGVDALSIIVEELYDVFREPEIRLIVQTARLREAVDVMKMEDCEMPKRIVLQKPEGKQGIGRPKARGMEEGKGGGNKYLGNSCRGQVRVAKSR